MILLEKCAVPKDTARVGIVVFQHNRFITLSMIPTLLNACSKSSHKSAVSGMSSRYAVAMETTQLVLSQFENF